MVIVIKAEKVREEAPEGWKEMSEDDKWEWCKDVLNSQIMYVESFDS